MNVQFFKKPLICSALSAGGLGGCICCVKAGIVKEMMGNVSPLGGAVLHGMLIDVLT